jgi:hypothetical protein
MAVSNFNEVLGSRAWIPVLGVPGFRTITWYATLRQRT